MSYKIISSGQFDKELKQLAKKFPSLKKDYEDWTAAFSLQASTFYRPPAKEKYGAEK